MSEAPHVRPLSVADPLADRAMQAELFSRYLVLDAFVGGLPRVGLEPLVLPRALHQRAVQAAEGAARVGAEVTRLCLDDPSLLPSLGLGPAACELVQANAHDTSTLSRVDLLLGEGGEVLACEVNADCPGGLNEATALPALSSRFLGDDLSQPGVPLEALANALAERAAGGTVGLLFATAYAEDLQVCALVERALAGLGVATARMPPTAPRAVGDALVGRNRTLAALYRFYPTEEMEGQRNVGDIASAVARRAVRVLSSFTAMVAQSKGSMALAHARRSKLSPEAQAALDAHVPHTVDLLDVHPEQLCDERARWVLKRSLGRVGDHVWVGALETDAEWREIVREIVDAARAGDAWVAQRFVPQRPVETPWGPRLVTLGAYVLDGHFCGYFSRLTEVSHVSHDALCLPTFVDEEA